MTELAPETRASYIVIIDDILANSNLETISSKKIRQGLQRRVDYDIEPQKDAIKEIIMSRFDKFVAEQNKIPVTTTNGHVEAISTKVISEPAVPIVTNNSNHKRKASSEDVDAIGTSADLSDTPHKKRKSVLDDDAAFAARLQAEENSRARPTRGGNVRKAPIIKKKKKKSAVRASGNDDSELSGSDAGKQRKVNRNSGFHKEFMLSAPLSELLEGETKLSRPQTVKRIWAYIKARDLQDPKDKRQIRCDDALRAVFKADKVHMFSMNKILSSQLYDPEA